MRSGIVWSCLLVQASFEVASAQEAVPARPVTGSAASEASVSTVKGKPGSGVIADYGPAFDRLVKLGLADAKGAKYVKLTLHGEAGQAAQMRQYQYGMGNGVELKTKGNAWRLPEANDTGGLATLIHAQYETVQVKKKQKRGGLMRLLVGPEKTSQNGGTAGDWSEQDAVADARQILEVLEKQAESGRVFQADRWEYSDTEAGWCANILVQACHVYRAGFTKEANQIAAKLLSLAPEPVRVVDHVVNNLAQQQYQSLASAFFKDKDWQAYRDGSKDLLKKFTRGWKSSEGVEMLVKQLDKRIAGEKPELTKLKGVNLKPEAVAIVDGWLAQEKPIVVDGPMCWILGDETLRRCLKNPNVGYYLQPSKQKWVKEISAMGMDGLIALAAATTDHSLMASKMGHGDNDYYGGYSSRSFSFGGGGGGDAAAEAQYASMVRPCSRGEIARKMLEKTLPDPENELSSASAAELQSIAYQWWLKHRSDSTSQLIRHFFKEGNNQQQLVAMVAMIKSDDASDAKLVEDFILGSDEPDEQTQMVTLYLKEKKGKAKPFFDQYSKILKEYTAGVDEDELDWQIRQGGGVEKFLKKLEVYVKDVSADKILADMRKGKLKVDDGFQMLNAVIAEGEIMTHFPDLVSIARQQKTVEEQVKVMRKLSQSVSQKYYTAARSHGDQKDANNEFEESMAKLLEPSKADWQWFLSQTNVVEDNKVLNGAPSLAAYMAWEMENIYFPQHQRTMMAMSQMMELEELWKFGMERANAVLNEGSDAYFPNPKNVKVDRIEAIRKKVTPMSSDEILLYQKELSIDEKLAWGDILAGFGEKLPDGVIELRRKVVRVGWSGITEKEKPLKLKIDALTQGKAINQEMIEGVLDVVLAHASEFHEHAISIQGAGDKGFGFVVQIAKGGWVQQMKEDILADAEDDLLEGKTKKLAGLFVYGDRGASSSFKREPAVEDDAKERKEMIESFLEKAKEGKSSYIMFLSETSESYIKKQAATDEDE